MSYLQIAEPLLPFIAVPLLFYSRGMEWQVPDGATSQRHLCVTARLLAFQFVLHQNQCRKRGGVEIFRLRNEGGTFPFLALGMERGRDPAIGPIIVSH